MVNFKVRGFGRKIGILIGILWSFMGKLGVVGGGKN
jgi:hypothetical protein